MPSSPACTMISSPRSKSTSDRLSACDGGVVSAHPIPAMLSSAPAIPGNRSVVSEAWLAYDIDIRFQHLRAPPTGEKGAVYVETARKIPASV